jgi:3-hydroxymyristoyl/3-hydroxydecanoyl-(acyl carrier protein) dehydratase
MSSAAFPHAYPFRFVDTVSQREEPSAGDGHALGRVRIRVTGNARASMGEGWQSSALYPEAIAQAALLLEGGDPEAGRRGYLAGVSDLSMERAPRAGETLEISVRLAGRFGPMFRFDGEVRGGDAGNEVLARGSVLVRKGGQAAEAD